MQVVCRMKTRAGEDGAARSIGCYTARLRAALFARSPIHSAGAISSSDLDLDRLGLDGR